ncbi:MAG: SAM-dependent DNA methyltransferase [Chlorobium sp.]|jgi:hypothetical protein|nr:SAM-dependent DNA methyltransferase [Chlorobium sp.]
MPLKKSELYSSLWQSCDELRGGMDASHYKDYVLVLLFVEDERFILLIDLSTVGESLLPAVNFVLPQLLEKQ